MVSRAKVKKAPSMCSFRHRLIGQCFPPGVFRSWGPLGKGSLRPRVGPGSWVSGAAAAGGQAEDGEPSGSPLLRALGVWRNGSASWATRERGRLSLVTAHLLQAQGCQAGGKMKGGGSRTRGSQNPSTVPWGVWAGAGPGGEALRVWFRIGQECPAPCPPRAWRGKLTNWFLPAFFPLSQTSYPDADFIMRG